MLAKLTVQYSLHFIFFLFLSLEVHKCSGVRSVLRYWQKKLPSRYTTTTTQQEMTTTHIVFITSSKHKYCFEICSPFCSPSQRPITCDTAAKDGTDLHTDRTQLAWGWEQKSSAIEGRSGSRTARAGATCSSRWRELSGARAHLAVQRTVLQSHWISTSILNFWIKKSKNLAHPPSYKTTFVAFEFKQMKQSALKQLAKYNTDKACIHQEFNCIPPCAIKSAQLLTRCIKNKTSFAPPTQMNFNLLWKN